jgi:hypothetical protein
MWPLSESEINVSKDKVQIKLQVYRAPTLLIVRVMVPMVFLTMVSWTGFYIKIGQLMPRFASGFISFLALQALRKYSKTFKNRDVNDPLPRCQ